MKPSLNSCIQKPQISTNTDSIYGNSALSFTAVRFSVLNLSVVVPV